jgi:hypothetical protein
LRLTVYYHLDEVSGSSLEDVILLAEAPTQNGQRQRLTLRYWTEVIQPYLAALIGLQDVINSFQGAEVREATLNTISAMRPDLPIGISLSGASQAILIVKNFVDPWRSDRAADLCLYLTGRPLNAEAESPAPTPVAPVAMTVMLHSDEAGPAARQAALAILHARLPDLAQAVAAHLAVLLAVDQAGLADRLLPSLSVLATSCLQMVLDKAKVEA